MDMAENESRWRFYKGRGEGFALGFDVTWKYPSLILYLGPWWISVERF